MNSKSVLATVFMGLLVPVLVLALPLSAVAQNTDKKSKTSEAMISKNAVGESQKPEESKKEIAKTPSSEDPKTDKKSTAAPKDADYWFDKGALCATYGNDRAAIKYFKKALSLDPDRSGAYFELGISHGQLEQFDQAITLINKAIEMEPQNGLYIYGRGRVHLLAGNEDQALEDFKKAADLNDEDAQTYLDTIAKAEIDTEAN